MLAAEGVRARVRPWRDRLHVQAHVHQWRHHPMERTVTF
jgi:hypothetical protein